MKNENFDEQVSQEQEPQPLADTLTEDPGYRAIRKELSDDWVSKHGQDVYSADYQDFVYGYGVGSKKKTLDELTMERFQTNNPDLVKRYDKQEETKVYPRYQDDPAYRKADEEATVAGNKARRRYPNLQGEGVMQSERMRAFDSFVRKYPEKAQGYAEDSPEIARAIERANQREQLRLEEQAKEVEKKRIEQSKEKETKLVEARRVLADLVPGYANSEQDTSNAIEVQETDNELVDNEEELNPIQNQESDREDESLPVLAENPEELRNVIQETIPDQVKIMSREDLEEKQETLQELPFLNAKEAQPLVDLQGQNEGVAFIEVNAIVGTVSPAFEDWSTEYDQRKGRAVDVASALIQGGAQDYERIFHTSDPDKGIKVKKFAAPKGDLFFVKDGTHRTAGAKLAEAGEIPAQVENMNAVDQVETKSLSQAEDWRERIKAGFIEGEVLEEENESGEKVYKLVIEKQILPWASLPQTRFLEMTKMYASLYPEALTGLKNIKTGEEIPQEALINEIAMNYYLADRWEEYSVQAEQ